MKSFRVTIILLTLYSAVFSQKVKEENKVLATEMKVKYPDSEVYMKESNIDISFSESSKVQMENRDFSQVTVQTKCEYDFISLAP